MATYRPGKAPRLVLTHLRGEKNGEAWMKDLPGYKSERQIEVTLKPLRERGLIQEGITLQKGRSVAGGEGWESVALTPLGETVADGINAGKRSF